MKDIVDFAGFEEKKYKPLIREHSKEILLNIISLQKPQKVLEIGSFIGYSASLMLEAGAQHVTTIEIDFQNAQFAQKNLQENFAGRFVVENCDALDFLKQHQEEKFDLVFLDGPKGQYIKYLPYIKKMLNPKAYIIADDVLFYGLVESEEQVPHKHRTIVVNLRKFLSELESDADFETQIYKFENGLCVSRKKA